MKKLLRCVSLIMIIAIISVFTAGCTANSYAIKVGNKTVSAKFYASFIKMQKQQYLSSMGISDSDMDWSKMSSSESEEEITIGEQLEQSVIDLLKSAKLYSLQFDNLGLSFTEKEKEEFENTLNTSIENAGGRDKFEEYLKDLGITYDEYVDYLWDFQKQDKVVDYYFGPNGKDPVSADEIKAYYKEKNVRIKNVLILKTDSNTGEDLTGSALQEAKDKAQKVLNLAKSQTEDKFDDLIEEYNQDSGVESYPDGYIFSKGQMSGIQVFEDAAFDMQVGEVRLVESDYGYHIMKKYDVLDKSVYTDETQKQALYSMRETELSEFLEEWEKNTTVKINNKVIIKYAVEKIKIEETTTDTQSEDNQ